MRPLVFKFYQLYHISAAFLSAALVIRWLILFPLVGSKFLPGGIHEFLCYTMVYCSVCDLIWCFGFHGFVGGLCSATFVKNMNLLYFVVVMHYYDDYEFALVLKNITYSTFIIGLGSSQAYYHCCKLFKGYQRRKKSIIWKFNTLFMLPLVYISELYLLLLNVQNPSFHSTPLLDIINKVLLVTFLPIALSFYRCQF